MTPNAGFHAGHRINTVYTVNTVGSYFRVRLRAIASTLFAFAPLAPGHWPANLPPAQPLRICSHSTPISPNNFVCRRAGHNPCACLESRIYLFVDHELAFTPPSFAALHQLDQTEPNYMVGFQRQHHQGMKHTVVPASLTKNSKLEFWLPKAVKNGSRLVARTIKFKALGWDYSLDGATTRVAG
jgi:hypothetical protein